jgi:hypothetical protein
MKRSGHDGYLLMLLRAAWFLAGPVWVQTAVAAEDPADNGGLGSRTRLTGDWGGVRDQWAEGGFAAEFDATYTFQDVAGGGLDGPVFAAFSAEDDTGHT